MILCIDPGLRGCGVALFHHNGQLDSARYVKNMMERGRGYEAHVEMARSIHAALVGRVVSGLVIEHPRIYGNTGSTRRGEDMNDLLDLVGVGAATASRLNCSVETVFPSEWKGQLEKARMTEHIIQRIAELGHGSIERVQKHSMHNVYDAIGIGLEHFDLLRKRVFPGAT